MIERYQSKVLVSRKRKTIMRKLSDFQYKKTNFLGLV